jgi:hypothetical protein
LNTTPDGWIERAALDVGIARLIETLHDRNILHVKPR